MLDETADAIFRALEQYPDGGTAKQVATDLGWKSTSASQRMGKLFWKGDLERDNVSSAHRGQPEYRYRKSTPKIDSPASQWKPAETRIARRVYERERG